MLLSSKLIYFHLKKNPLDNLICETKAILSRSQCVSLKRHAIPTQTKRRLSVNAVEHPHQVQYIPRNMHTVFALLCFVVVIHWLIFPYPSGLLHWHCGILTISPVPAKQPWLIWINTSCEFIMNDCITTTKQSTTKPCAYFLGYTVSPVCRSNKLGTTDSKRIMGWLVQSYLD